MLELSHSSHLLEQKSYKYQLQDVAEPVLYRDAFNYEEAPKIAFNHRRVPMAMPEDIWITDTTFRDGQQSMDPFSVEQIVTLYKLMSRLSGPKVEHSGDPNIISDGIPLGAVQVPGSGEPMIMMSEHQGSGGYTKIATVISVDIPLVAQCPPGSTIRFQAVTVEEAQRLYLEQLAEYDRLEQSFCPPPAAAYQVTVNGKTYRVEISPQP